MPKMALLPGTAGFLLVLCAVASSAVAQHSDAWTRQDSPGKDSSTVRHSAQWAFRVGSVATVAGRTHQPLWLVANRYGTIRDEQADLSTFAGARGSYRLGKHWAVSGGINIYLNRHFSHAFMQQGYVRLSYRNWQLKGGRFEEIVGEVSPALSSGSWGISRNALPIPKILLSTNGYVPVPFTRSWVQVKGRFGHGWLGRRQYVQDAFLHEKSLYLRVGPEKWNFHGGINHFAQWAGNHPQGKMPSRVKDYLRILAGRSGDAGDPVYQEGPIDIANAVGNHLAMFDFGFTLRLSQSTCKLYTQTLFERGTAQIADQRDRIVGFKLLSPDRLVGISWETEQNSIIKGVVFEWLNTRHQGGSVIFVGRDNYYNHTIYRTGWVYQDQIIGTPLFITQTRARHYKLSQDGVGDQNIVSNRISGVHLGIRGQLTGQIQWRTLVTYLRHSGNYYNEAFTPAKSQGHFLQEVVVRLGKAFTGTAALGYDFGDLSTHPGGMLGVAWTVGK